MKKWERVRGASTVLGCAGCASVVEGVDPREGRREDGEGGKASLEGREGGRVASGIGLVTHSSVPTTPVKTPTALLPLPTTTSQTEGDCAPLSVPLPGTKGSRVMGKTLLGEGGEDHSAILTEEAVELGYASSPGGARGGGRTALHRNAGSPGSDVTPTTTFERRGKGGGKGGVEEVKAGNAPVSEDGDWS